MPSFWKIGRELKRFGRNLAAAPAYSLRWLTATAYHDRILTRGRRTWDGAVPMGDRVAIYLIFPQDGLLPSHRRAILHLQSSGYAPLIVSNGPLTDADRAQVLRSCFRLIERTNFGYDFGGYRDGILSLAADLGRLDRLVLVNDSTWFPLPGTEDWLPASEQLGVDFAGAVWTGAVRRVAPDAFGSIAWKVDKARRNFHYASFALNIAGPILHDPGFLRFWKGFRLSQDKNRTVRRGEIGLTAWVMRHGFTHAATHELSNLDAEIRRLGDAEFWALWDSAVIFDDAEVQGIAARLAMTAPGDRSQHESLLLTAVSRRGASYALADYLVRFKGFGFLKKSPARQPGKAAEVIAALARDLGDPGREILAEIGRAESTPVVEFQPRLANRR